MHHKQDPADMPRCSCSMRALSNSRWSMRRADCWRHELNGNLSFRRGSVCTYEGAPQPYPPLREPHGFSGGSCSPARQPQEDVVEGRSGSIRAGRRPRSRRFDIWAHQVLLMLQVHGARRRELLQRPALVPMHAESLRRRRTPKRPTAPRVRVLVSGQHHGVRQQCRGPQ